MICAAAACLDDHALEDVMAVGVEGAEQVGARATDHQHQVVAIEQVAIRGQVLNLKDNNNEDKGECN